MWGLAVPTAFGQGKDLATKSAHEVGIAVSHYKYTEPDVLSIKGLKMSLDYSGTYAFDSYWPSRGGGWFLRGDLRYSRGKVDYNSGLSGSIDDRPDWYYEVKGLVGKDFYFSNYTLSPYIGLGYRHLYNDLRGVSTTGARGFRRESDYYTLPLGVTHRANLTSKSQLVTTIEYSYLIRGRQDSKLSDALPGIADVTLRQPSGYGVRVGTMLKFDTWSIGPTLTYWNIQRSDIGGTPPVVEPKNNTLDFGVRAAYHF